MVLLIVIILGFYFNDFLKKSFLETTQTRFFNAYERLAADMNNIAEQLKEGISFIKTDESILASIELINNYQDKNNYNIYLIDEEKKRIANKLLNKVKLSFNNDIALYDINHELVAFVIKEKNLYRINYLSYDNGHPVLFSRMEDEFEFQKQPFYVFNNILFKHVDLYKSWDALVNTIITYHQTSLDQQEMFTIKSHLSISENRSDKIISHIEMSRILDREYYEELSSSIGVKIAQHAYPPFNQKVSQINDDIDINSLHINEGDEEFITALSHPSKDGDVYFYASLNKSALNKLLHRNKDQFMILLIFTALGTLVVSRLFINKAVDEPLSMLMAQIHKIKNHDYSPSAVPTTQDEIELISENINQLALAVEERESALKQSMKEFEYLSEHDVLTNLLNRRFFSHRLKHALDLVTRNHGRLALLFFDLDQFKLVNDTLGHDIGDKLLIEVSKRLSAQIRASDTLARIGGDEFYLLIENSPEPYDLIPMIEKLLDVFKEPFICSGHTIAISASIGVSLYPDNGTDSVTLIKNADLAMYSAKEHGRNRYEFFSFELSKNAQERAFLIRDLEHSIETFEQFELYYQPKISTRDHQVVSVEALLRWHRPQHGLVMPAQFIPIAEETGLIVKIGTWVLEQACHDFMRMIEEGIHLERVCINLSSVQMECSDVLHTIMAIVERGTIDFRQIELEITESYIATDAQHAVELLKSFSKLGVGLAIDDFGIGYSSMSYLQQLPINRLKIDKSFVDGLPSNKDSVTITEAIIGLSKSLNLQITAEGVENEAQLKFLEALHCDEIQGYYFSEPLSYSDFVQFCKYKASSGSDQVLKFSDYKKDLS